VLRGPGGGCSGSAAAQDGTRFIPAADRIATFDNDRTLRVEQPLVPQFDFVFRKWIAEAKADRVLRMFGVKPVRAKVARILFGPTFLADPANTPIVDEWAQRLNNHRAGLQKAVQGVIERQSLDAELPSISVPTLVAVGADDMATPPAKSRRIASRIPGAGLEAVPRSGHTISLEQPAVVSDLLSEFLATQIRERS
jgi:pimeloyl-ACP methyl ester carboxylesterase